MPRLRLSLRFTAAMPSISSSSGSWQKLSSSIFALLWAAARALGGQGPAQGTMEQSGHAPNNLAYAYLQTGQDQLARNVRDEFSSYYLRTGSRTLPWAYSRSWGFLLVTHWRAISGLRPGARAIRNSNATCRSLNLFREGVRPARAPGDLAGG